MEVVKGNDWHRHGWIFIQTEPSSQPEIHDDPLDPWAQWLRQSGRRGSLPEFPTIFSTCPRHYAKLSWNAEHNFIVGTPYQLTICCLIIVNCRSIKKKTYSGICFIPRVSCWHVEQETAHLVDVDFPLEGPPWRLAQIQFFCCVFSYGFVPIYV